ncbi:6-hydroxymethylpterin diphosphokinase MptE-like protein [Methylomonas rapida]|uniref:DUF115 domain-containing protein n=1 Tax=Methylomonas rapida TaxID=2963939 RepID=A0ABY7GLR5_9GAMM|nr:6-hydroxymethylpterin diphosphokinase MptE-like protein [Methylomonas rapida]WAR45418.1 DUF115 domain-containing protein [Methylomonas rapida]
MKNEAKPVVEHLLGPLTSNRFGDRFLFNINRHVFDKVSAEVMFGAQFDDALFKENVLNIIVGTDSGLLPRYIQNKSLPNGARYIFIEPDAVLQALHEHQLLVDLDERIACISLESWAEATTNFKIADYFYINAVRSFNAICAQNDFIEEYSELSWYIAEILSQSYWEHAVQLGQEAFIARQIDNVAENRIPAKLLQNAFSGKTVVLLAGGPSLNDALPWVKLNRQRVVLFAVSRISRQLIAADIEPDFVFSVDPQDISFDVSKEMLNFGPRTTFVCSYHAVPTLLNQWPGQMLYLGERLPWESALNVPNFSGAGPTVTNAALNTAYNFGFKRVILAGVDLCYTRDGFTHAKGSNEALAGPKFNLTSLQVETNGGFMAPTGLDYAQAINSLAMQAKILTAAGCQIFNVSEGAAKIDAVEFRPITEIQLEEQYLDAQKIVAGKVSNVSDEVHYLQKVLAELKRAQYQIKAIARLSAEARRINDAMYSPHGVIENYKDKKKLDQIEKKFKREHRHFSRLVKRFGIRRFIQIAKPYSDAEWTAEEARQLGNVFYDAYKEGAGNLLRLINDAIERVISRQQEHAHDPDFAMLAEQYRKDRSFGRVRLLRQKPVAVLIPREMIPVFDEYERQFVEIINDKDTRHLAIVKEHSNLGFLKHRGGLLFKHKKVEELRDLLVSLDKYQSQDDVAPYRHLISGYLAELGGRSEEALYAYQQIIDGGDVLLEEALIRIAAIGFDEDDKSRADLALQCLSQLNPVYLPLYAEMRRLHGDVMVAIDAYNSYIGQFPQDTLVQMKLAMLYFESKIYDAAEMILAYILQQKPGLEVAISMRQQLLALKTASN